MLIKNFSILLILVLLVSCNDDNGLFETIPESDILALEGMDEAYDQANHYNELMEHCIEDGDQCSHDNLLELDSLFHQFDKMFDTHHNNYSHNNLGDDHHHEGGNNIRHGGMMHNDIGDEHNNNEEHGYEHSMQTFEMMMNLREIHEEVHPG